MRARHLFAPVLAAALLPGCVVGLVYHHTLRPLDLDAQDTPVYVRRTETGTADMKSVQYYVRIEWDGYDLATAARQYGIEEIQYADIEELSVFGVWNRTWAHVYGRPVTDPAPPASAAATD